MKIVLSDKWKIETDEHNYVLFRKVKRKKDSKDIKWSTFGYYSDLEYLVSELFERGIRELEADTLQELMDKVIKLKKELTVKIVASQKI